MRPYKIIISGGGTGGHIYPALAIARECERRWSDCEILFVGASDRMEMQKVPAAGYKIEGLWISGLQRSLSIDNLAFPIKVVKSLIDARKIINRFNPDVAIGTGGYASGPVLYAAAQKNIPTLIQEQNSYAGITNKLLGKKVDKICVASDEMEKFFPAQKIVKTGNPVRQDLMNLEHYRNDALSTFSLDANKKTLLVIGGSLGARRINELIEKNYQRLLKDVQIIWQCGAIHHNKYKQYDQPGVRVKKYIEDMHLAYAAADFIISRAGAGSISELSILGMPAILIPSPHVAENHQVKNAEHMAAKDAVLMIEEKNLDAMFMSVWEKLFSSDQLQRKLSGNIQQLAMPDATREIVDIIQTLIND